MAHSIYNLLTIYGTWFFVSSDLNNNAREVTRKQQQEHTPEPIIFKENCRAVKLIKYLNCYMV